MAAVDYFANSFDTLDSPSRDGVAVTPSDSTDLAAVCKVLYVGGAGNIAVITLAGNSLTFTSVAAGTILPIRASRVMATGTTATNIVALQ